MTEEANTGAEAPAKQDTWRHALCWVCVLGYVWQFFIVPTANAGLALIGKGVVIAPLDSSALAALTTTLLGLSALHTVERVQGG
jgi:hypothetical protein